MKIEIDYNGAYAICKVIRREEKLQRDYQLMQLD